jgi:hypothetical protein
MVESGDPRPGDREPERQLLHPRLRVGMNLHARLQPDGPRNKFADGTGSGKNFGPKRTITGGATFVVCHDGCGAGFGKNRNTNARYACWIATTS